MKNDAAAQLAQRILDELEKEWLPPYGDEERAVVAALIREAWKVPGGAKVTRSKRSSRSH